MHTCLRLCNPRAKGSPSQLALQGFSSANKGQLTLPKETFSQFAGHICQISLMVTQTQLLRTGTKHPPFLLTVSMRSTLGVATLPSTSARGTRKQPEAAVSLCQNLLDPQKGPFETVSPQQGPCLGRIPPVCVIRTALCKRNRVASCSKNQQGLIVQSPVSPTKGQITLCLNGSAGGHP